MHVLDQRDLDLVLVLLTESRSGAAYVWVRVFVHLCENL